LSGINCYFKSAKGKRLVAAVFIVVICIAAGGFIFWNTQSRHYPLYRQIYAIKNRLLINITDPAFPSTGTRECIWYELREEDSGDYFQTTVNFWVFQAGQEKHGDVEAFVEIYNVPNVTDRFIVEVTRNTWSELTVSLDGSPIVVFPTVSQNVLSYGYMTFEVSAK
jgi:hypothetical protein